jgi:phage-related protein
MASQTGAIPESGPNPPFCALTPPAYAPEGSQNIVPSITTLPPIPELIYFMADASSRKPLYSEGSSKKDFKEFPVEVQKDMGVALFVVQIGGMPPSSKAWRGLGSGVYELIEDHRGDTYRAVYTVRIHDTIHILHAFQKKSKSGISTPQQDVTLIETRLKALLARSRKEGRK